MKSRLLLAVLAVIAPAACGDPLSARASFETVEDTLAVFAFSDTPLSAPSGLNTIRHEAVRVDASSDYDIVFDISPDGQAVIYPPRLIGAVGNAGVRTDTTGYARVLEAPADGYNDSTATTVAEGDVVLVRAASPSCVTAFNPYIYSKLVIDSVRTPSRTIYFRMRVDPNCGFRGLAEGVPGR